jgi:hypothetical protein
MMQIFLINTNLVGIQIRGQSSDLGACFEKGVNERGIGLLQDCDFNIHAQNPAGIAGRR